MKDFKLIKLTKNHFAMVDPDLFDFLNQWSWLCNSSGYAVRHVTVKKNIKKAILMHNLIIDNNEINTYVDHINGIRADNRRKNLRLCTRTENAQNYPGWSKKTSSLYKGVFPRGNGKWRVIIQADGKRYNLGDYSSETEAAKIYNKNALLLHGNFANLNKIEEKTSTNSYEGDQNGTKSC